MKQYELPVTRPLPHVPLSQNRDWPAVSQHQRSPEPSALSANGALFLQNNLRAIQRTQDQPHQSPKEYPEYRAGVSPLSTGQDSGTEVFVKNSSPVVQRVLSELSFGLRKKWISIKSNISLYNKSRHQSLFFKVWLLKNIEAAANDYNETVKVESEITRTIEEVGPEISKVFKGVSVLSEAALKCNSELRIMGATEITQFKANAPSLKEGIIELAAMAPKLTPLQEIYLCKAISAGRTKGVIIQFTKRILKMDDPELYETLNLTRMESSGPRQQYADFCSSATVVTFRAKFDPVYALELADNTKDFGARMDETEKSPSQKWLYESMKQDIDGEQNNVFLLKEQFKVAKLFSKDKSGRMGLTKEDRADAFNSMVGMTGLTYVPVSLAGLRVMKKGFLGEKVVSQAGPEERRMEPASFLLEYALDQGCPVGVGVGGHADMFVDYSGGLFTLYEPSYGTIKQVKKRDINAGFSGSDPLANLVVPKLANERYMECLTYLLRLGETKDEVIDLRTELDMAIEELSEDLAHMYGWGSAGIREFAESDEARERAQQRILNRKKETPSYIS